MGVLRAMRFGLLAEPAADAAGWRRTVGRASDLGYSALLVPDHLDRQWGPLVSLAIAAEQGGKLALGPLMLATGLRNPVLLFKELATLAQFAPAGLEIGLGAGWLAADFTCAGAEFAAPATRIGQLSEAVQILKALWADGQVSFQGGHYQITDAPGRPRPPAGTAVKWVLGGGGRRMLEVAARHADIVSLSARMFSGHKNSAFGRTATAEEFGRRAEWVRDYAGDRLPGIELQCLVFAAAVVADRHRYANRVLSPMFGLPPDQALASPLALVGLEEEICGQLLSHREQFGISYWVVRGAQMEQFAPVVAKMTGA
jgi:probable F420-dependent oxidoreductase